MNQIWGLTLEGRTTLNASASTQYYKRLFTKIAYIFTEWHNIERLHYFLEEDMQIETRHRCSAFCDAVSHTTAMRKNICNRPVVYNVKRSTVVVWP